MKKIIVILISFMSINVYSEVNYIGNIDKEVKVVSAFVGNGHKMGSGLHYVIDKTNKLCFARLGSGKSEGAILVPCKNLLNTPTLKKHITWIK